jgi:hypothetical protein
MEDTQLDLDNLRIKLDLFEQNHETKVKLLEEALTRRNDDLEQGEENNKQLLNLLEKYDQKLDELQEDNELKDMKIFEYEREVFKDKPKIRIDSIEEKVHFLATVLHRLKIMYLEGVNNLNYDESNQIEDYPRIPTSEYDNALITPNMDLPLDKLANNALEAVEVIELNRNIRRQF